MTKEEIIKLIESKFEQAVKEMKAIEGAPLSFLQSAGEVQALEILLAEIKKTNKLKDYTKTSFAFKKHFHRFLGLTLAPELKKPQKKFVNFLTKQSVVLSIF